MSASDFPSALIFCSTAPRGRCILTINAYFLNSGFAVGPAGGVAAAADDGAADEDEDRSGAAAGWPAAALSHIANARANCFALIVDICQLRPTQWQQTWARRARETRPRLMSVLCAPKVYSRKGTGEESARRGRGVEQWCRALLQYINYIVIV